MKVLNLQCVHSHAFEGWFGSEDDFQSQLGRGLVGCPMCGSVEVCKLPSAPRLNLGNAAEPVSRETQAVAAPGQEMQAAWLRMVRHVVENTDDVGPRFAEEARRIHHGEAPERGIRGEASAQETRELLEEGIGVLPLPIPRGMKGSLQ